MIERIAFNTSGWHEHERDEAKDWVVWGNAGDILSLTVYPSQWKTFPMERDKYLLREAREMARPGGIVSVDACTAASRPAIQIIYKRTHDMGYVYTGILIVEFSGRCCQITVVAGESRITGVREAVLTPRFLNDGRIKMRRRPFYLRVFKRSSDYHLDGWFTDPYDAKYRGLTLRSVTDDEEYDQEFPDHPLSRLRSILRGVRDSLQFLDATHLG